MEIKDRSPRLSAITITYGAYLVISASFMVQVNLWLAGIFGNIFLIRSFWAAIIVLFISIIAYAIKNNLGSLRIALIIFIFLISYIISMWPQYFEEKTHIVMYAILGYLASGDLIGRTILPRFKIISSVTGFIILISASDEIFQLLLPYRFGDINDFILNLSGGILGICIFLALNKTIHRNI